MKERRAERGFKKVRLARERLFNVFSVASTRVNYVQSSVDAGLENTYRGAMTDIDWDADRIQLRGADALAYAKNPFKLKASSLSLSGGLSEEERELATELTELELPRWAKLKNLSVGGWPNLASLTVTAPLTTFSLGGCPNLTNIAPLPRLTSLTMNDPLQHLSGSFGKLTTLHQCSVGEDTDLSVFDEMRKLTYLGVTTRLGDLSFVKPLSALRCLRVKAFGQTGQFTNLAGLEGLSKLTNLEALSAQLTDISALTALTSLREIEFTGCTLLADISALAEHKKIRSIKLSETKVTATKLPDCLLPPRSRSPIWPPALAKRGYAAQKKRKAAAKAGK